MDLVRLLHLADLHLGWTPPWEGLRFDRSAERDARLAHAVDWALQNQIDLIIIAGDLFESHTPSSDLVGEAKRQLRRAVGAGIVVVTVPGNHDEISYHNSVYRQHATEWPGILVQNPHFDHCETVSIHGHAIHLYGLAYTGGLTQTSPPLADFPRMTGDGFHLAILHGSLDFDAGDRSLPIDLKALIGAGFNYCALGHIHQHLSFGPSTHPIVYAGMIDGKGFDDPGVGHYTVVTLREGATDVERVPAPGRKIQTLELDVGAYIDEGQLVEALTSQFTEGDIVRIRLEGSPEFQLYPETLKANLAQRAAYVDIVNEIDQYNDERLRQIALEPTIRGAFVERMMNKLHQTEDERHRRLVRRAILHGLAVLEGGETS